MVAFINDYQLVPKTIDCVNLKSDGWLHNSVQFQFVHLRQSGYFECKYAECIYGTLDLWEC